MVDYLKSPVVLIRLLKLSPKLHLRFAQPARPRRKFFIISAREFQSMGRRIASAHTGVDLFFALQEFARAIRSLVF